MKSQRGGPGEILVNKVVDWPQNFILTGNRKSRPTYGDLIVTQLVSGFVRCIQKEKSGETRASMLDYLGNLMEDASDFSWESAKASHAVVLTNMEADGYSGLTLRSWIESVELMHKGIYPRPVHCFQKFCNQNDQKQCIKKWYYLQIFPGRYL